MHACVLFQIGAGSVTTRTDFARTVFFNSENRTRQWHMKRSRTLRDVMPPPTGCPRCPLHAWRVQKDKFDNCLHITLKYALVENREKINP